MLGQIRGIRAFTKHSLLCWPWPHHPIAQFQCYGRILSERLTCPVDWTRSYIHTRKKIFPYLQGVPQLMSHPKIARHSKTGTRLATVFLHTYPLLNVSDAASKRPGMPDNRVASGTKLIPIHLFGCSKLGRHQRFSRHFVLWFPGWSPTDFLSVTDQSYCPVTRLSPSMLESANGTYHFLVHGAGYPEMLSFFVIGHVCQNFDFTGRSFILPVRHRRQSYLVEYLLK